MLKVGMDVRTLARENPRGIGRYAGNLIHYVRQVDRDVQFYLYYDADQKMPEVARDPEIIPVPFRFRGDRWRLWERVGLPLRAWWSGVDILHCPGNLAPVWQPVPTVITVHDTMLWDYPQESGYAPQYTAGPLTKALRRARALITISQASRRDLVARFPWTAEKLTVIPHGISETFLTPCQSSDRDRMRKQYGLTAPFILYVGGAAPRKRASWALRLFKAWRTAGPAELYLVLMGFAAGSDREIREEAARLEIDRHIHVLPTVGEELLPAIYSESEFVVFPSLAEGFGFPALEAQACGRTVLVSNTTSLPEVSGPAARRLAPENFEEWLEAGKTLLTQGMEATLSQESRNWAARFSWQAAARETLNVYRRMMEIQG